MTRKHFIEIAKILGKNTSSKNVWDDTLIIEFVSFLQKQNPNFDKMRFMDYVQNIKNKP
jgi:hypothetical protein